MGRYISLLLFVGLVCGQGNPCEDERYLRLQKVIVTRMSDDDYKYYKNARNRCKDFNDSLDAAIINAPTSSDDIAAHARKLRLKYKNEKLNNSSKRPAFNKSEKIIEDEIFKFSKNTKNSKKNPKELIEKQFSPWDGSHRGLTRFIKENMNDPDSFEHIETRFRDDGNSIFVITKFRGTNAFGGKVINYISARVDFNGNVIEVVSQN